METTWTVANIITLVGVLANLLINVFQTLKYEKIKLHCSECCDIEASDHEAN